jgi:hypothetical protein
VQESLSTITRTPQESADNLVVALNRNTSALNAVKRRYRALIAVIIVLVTFIGFDAWGDHQDNINICASGNLLRSEIDAKFDTTAAELSPFISDAPGQQFIEVLREDLSRRDCSDLPWL